MRIAGEMDVDTGLTVDMLFGTHHEGEVLTIIKSRAADIALKSKGLFKFGQK